MAKITLFSMFLLFVLLLSSITSFSSAVSDRLRQRRLLHQPLFPLEPDPPSTAPALPPQPSQRQPKLPFSTTPSTTATPNSFFPTTVPFPPPPTTTPPPAPTGYLPTFPANISSLLLPHAPSTSPPRRRHLAVIAASVSVLSAALIVTLAAFVHFYRRHPVDYDPTDKAARNDSVCLFPPDTTSSDSAALRPHSFSNSSTEFLYLGTLPNPPGISGEIDMNSSNASGKISITGLSSASAYQKIGSPELKPLPPLPRSNFMQKNWNSEAGSSSDGHGEEDDDEVFFSPRGSSSMGRENKSPDNESLHNLSSSRREHPAAVGADRFGSRSFNSRTASYPFSNSGSSRNTASNSPSPPLIESPVSLKSSSPEVMILRFPVPSRPPPPPPPPHNGSPDGPNILSPSLSSSARASDVSTGQMESSMVSEDASNLKRFVPKKLPPPPPPPVPPPRFWERPPIVHDLVYGPPVLSEPSRPAVLQDPEAGHVQTNGSLDRHEDMTRPRLKPLHWDKVRASSDRVMVWDQIKSSSFQLNEEMIQRLFVVNGSNPSTAKENARHPLMPLQNQETQVLDPKKSQNVSILLRALNVTVEEVCESLLEGNADSLGSELLESLLKMAPTKEEERKLREFKDNSPFKLGPAEKFLKALLDIPFAFKRADAMLYVINFETECDYLKRCFETLEAASKELKSSKLFLKLLEAVLKTGNRMNVGTNRGDAHAFKLDTLLKLVDVKGADGKTTLLHFVVQEIVRSEGSKLHGGKDDANGEFAIHNEVEFKKLGLQVVSGLSGELTSVKKAATMDSTVLSNEVSKLALGIARVKDIVKLNGSEMNGRFVNSMNGFLAKAEDEIRRIQEQERATLTMVKEITEYFHGNSAKEEAHPLRIFMVVRDFLSTLDRVCREVGKVNERTIYSSARQVSMPAGMNPTMVSVFPMFDMTTRGRDGPLPDNEGPHSV
ncbi:hypothetical protein SAY86_025627 [Trapa natans]|uniref:Formin-like protein n=1 Tax=Trapa natans TaxID=22666 RepID=A0AAN7QDP1_TRANT|nr:hypothetical protein SAY86_025627 [Trapa natans]